MLGDSGDAEDRVQDALARLWARRHLLQEEGSLRALLYTMVRNGCLDEIRRRTRREHLEGHIPSPTPTRTPWEDIHGAELQRAAAAAVARLPSRRGEVFRLVREEGLTYQEVARVLNLSAQTVANHMSLAMADLRTALRPFLSGSERGGEERQSPEPGYGRGPGPSYPRPS
jgi:RNA polymerase sigma-70 factor (ECF subfamily)